MRTESENGITLLEVVLALVILGCGVLGSIGISTITTRTLADGRWATVLTATAASRLDLLRLGQGGPGACAGLAGGTWTTGAVTETWSAGGTGASGGLGVVVHHAVVARFPPESLTTLVPCR